MTGATDRGDRRWCGSHVELRGPTGTGCSRTSTLPSHSRPARISKCRTILQRGRPSAGTGSCRRPSRSPTTARSHRPRDRVWASSRTSPRRAVPDRLSMRLTAGSQEVVACVGIRRIGVLAYRKSSPSPGHGDRSIRMRDGSSARRLRVSPGAKEKRARGAFDSCPSISRLTVPATTSTRADSWRR